MYDEFAPIRNQKVRDWMRTNIVTVNPETKVGEVISLFVERRLNIIPVIDEKGRLLGKIRESDAMKLFFHPKHVTPEKIFSVGFDFGYFAENAQELMRRYKTSLSPDDTVGDAAKKMVEHEVTSLPVVNEKNQLIGIFSAKDLFHGLIKKKHLGLVTGTELLGERVKG